MKYSENSLAQLIFIFGYLMTPGVLVVLSPLAIEER